MAFPRTRIGTHGRVSSSHELVPRLPIPAAKDRPRYYDCRSNRDVIQVFRTKASTQPVEPVPALHDGIREAEHGPAQGTISTPGITSVKMTKHGQAEAMSIRG
jgi:hypothetical protein